MSDTVQQIKERLTIVDVVGGYVKLTRAGKYWKGLSPFTKEKTPSFFVSPDKGLYHCFSTGKGGDLFTFVEEMEGVDFKGALALLAEKAGVQIVHESKEARDERTEIFDALEAACQFFESTYARREDARAYLEGRGLQAVTAHHWRVGYAPKEWRALSEHLLHKGFTDHVLLKAGLTKLPDREDGAQSEKRPYDRFRGRIMFPIFDASGRVIAFSGRIFEDDAAHPQAKYLNSPEGPLFDKSRALYGIHEAKSHIRTLGFSMLVEGQMDLLLAHQTGYRSAVATSGTSLTASHVEVLKRYSSNVLLSYDGDKAGVSATYRAALLLLAAQLQVKVVPLPDGLDPAELIRTNAAAYKSAVRGAQSVSDFFAAHLVRTIPDERARARDVRSFVLPLIAAMNNAMEQSHAITRAGEVLGIREDALRTELNKLKTEHRDVEDSGNPFFTDDARERMLYGMYRTYLDAGRAEAQKVRDTFVEEYGEDRLLVWQNRGESEDDAARIVASENFFMLHQEGTAEERALQEILAERRRGTSPARIAYDRVSSELKKAEAEHRPEDVARLMAELRELSKKLE